MKEENVKSEYQRKVDKSLIPTCNIMGVNIAAINMNWLLKYIDENLSDIKGDYICVSNVHTTVTSYEDAAYCAVQNGGLMAIPDGGPLSSVGRKRGYSDMDRTTGPSLMGEIFKISAEKGYRHYFYGSTEETLKLLEEKLQENYPGIQIAGMYGEKEIAIITSRGCAFDCAFCGGAKSLNKDITTRIRTEESVITEIREILSAYPDIQSIRVLDDLFLRNGKSIDMTNNIFLKFPHLSWRGMVHVLSLAKDVEKVKKLRRGGCRELFIGIESGSESVRRKINKLGTIDDIITVSKAILESGIDLKGYFIYGFPGETKEDFQKTYELASKIKEISTNTTGTFRTSVFQFRPYHGTQLYNEIVKSTGIIHECEFNQSISKFEGRSQFNFDFGNYSKEKDEILSQYIIKTQELTKEEK